MITQIIDALKGFAEYLKFWVVIDPWQKGCVLRFGKFNRAIDSGFHWKFPLAETASIQSVATTTTSLSAQSIIAPDGKIYTVEGVVKWSVFDIRPFVCDIWDSENVIIDSAKSAIAEIVSKKGIADMAAQVTTKSKFALKKYGIAVETVTITTLAPVRCFRLISSDQPTPTQ